MSEEDEHQSWALRPPGCKRTSIKPLPRGYCGLRETLPEVSFQLVDSSVCEVGRSETTTCVAGGLPRALGGGRYRETRRDPRPAFRPPRRVAIKWTATDIAVRAHHSCAKKRRDHSTRIDRPVQSRTGTAIKLPAISAHADDQRSIRFRADQRHVAKAPPSAQIGIVMQTQRRPIAGASQAARREIRIAAPQCSPEPV